VGVVVVEQGYGLSAVFSHSVRDGYGLFSRLLVRVSGCDGPVLANGLEQSQRSDV
jgi:hypothetical protein